MNISNIIGRILGGLFIGSIGGLVLFLIFGYSLVSSHYPGEQSPELFEQLAMMSIIVSTVGAIIIAIIMFFSLKDEFNNN